MRGPIFILVILFLLYAAWDVSKPWQDNYFLKKALESVAQYATKNGDDSVQKELKSMLIEKGFDDIISPEQISIEKDPDTSAVSLRAEYSEPMTLFGYKIKDVDFVISIQAAYVRSQF